VVPAVAFAAHRTFDPLLGKQTLIVGGCVLHAAIGSLAHMRLGALTANCRFNVLRATGRA
jgi:hypothetical protein